MKIDEFKLKFIKFGNNLINSCNRKWIYLDKGENKIQVVGDCTITFMSQYEVRIQMIRLKELENIHELTLNKMDGTVLAVIDIGDLNSISKSITDVDKIDLTIPKYVSTIYCTSSSVRRV